MIQENINITMVGKVTLHVWTSNWGQRPAAAAEALKLAGRWTRTPRGSGQVGLPLPTFGVRRYYPLEICEDVGSNMCNFVHFGVKKNKHFKQKH